MKKCKIMKGYHEKIGEYTYCATHQNWLEDLFEDKPLPPCALVKKKD